MNDGAPNRRVDCLRDPLDNRGTAFTEAQRERLGLTGFLPPRVETLDEQAARVLETLRAKASPIERYGYLSALQNENETLFYRVAMANLQEVLPLIYTPTVGQACLDWSRLYLQPRGLYITPEHRGSIAGILRGWPRQDVVVIVVTDGGRILGLGDLGANGMGIPIGKLALYTACAGVPPSRCLPVTLDVGTDTAGVRDDRFYLGRRVPRLTGEAYDALLEEFVAATQEVFPGVIVQFEDFNNANAFRLLARYRDRLCCFNDDIQGTGAMGLAGVYAAGRLTGRKIGEERILFFGAGEACLGVGMAVVAALQSAGLSAEQAHARCLFIDSKGAVVTGRSDLPQHKRIFAQDRPATADLVATIEDFRPTILFGACGHGGMFTQAALEAMAKHCPQPVIFSLSNPTSKSECTAEQAYAWTGGKAVFASGSPFEPVTLGGRTHEPGQSNNSYIFPGVGLGLIVSGARRVTDAMFLAAATALAGQVSADDLAKGRIFPPQAQMREVAQAVACAVATVAFGQGLASRPVPPDLAEAVRQAMYQPVYAP
jgi:malate dehydrogenase (oxaloacetate-decarboxylating)(NADP+)